jgi:hypothetical protein
MHFVNPVFLYALFAVSIPVIIHLFNFRKYRKVYFSDVTFLQEIKRETQRRSELRHLLVLLARVLAVAALVLAFAQPYLPRSEMTVDLQEKSAVSIYVDNSFSMEAESEGGQLLALAKEKAREIAASYKSSDLFQLLTNDFEGRHQRLYARDEFLNLLDEVTTSPVSRTMPEVMRRQSEMLSTLTRGGKASYLISDYQESFLQGEPIREDTAVTTYLVPVKALQANNLYIDSCWFVSPVQQKDLRSVLQVRIRNSSSTAFQRIPLKLTINGRQRALASFDIGEGSLTDIALPYTDHEAGIQSGVLEITDYPLTFDDSFYFSYKVISSISVVCINGKEENMYLNSLFVHDSLFSFRNLTESSIDYSRLSANDLVILHGLVEISSGLGQVLTAFLDNGGSLAVFPPANLDPAGYAGFLVALGAPVYGSLDTVATRIDRVSYTSPVFRDVFDEIPENIDLPAVLKQYSMKSQVKSLGETLLESQNGKPFLVYVPCKKGSAYLFSAALDPAWSNFVKHAIFVPVIHRIALLSAPRTDLFYVIGDERAIKAGSYDLGNDEVIRISNERNDMSFIPEQRFSDGRLEIFVHGQVRQAGNYFIRKGNEKVEGLSFDYDRKESVTACMNNAELEEMIHSQGLLKTRLLYFKDKSFSQAILEMNQGVRLWKWFVVLALFFFGVEVLLLRFLR